MKELFLIYALALPAVPYRATPHWDFGAPEVKIVRMLRDYPNGGTASRPQGWVLIYGRHPLWMSMLRQDGIKVIGMWRHKVAWPHYIVGDPLKSPFRDALFQIYIFDEFPLAMHTLSAEVSRIVSPAGFFLYRYTKNGAFSHALAEFGWERFDLDFHEFTIWWRPKHDDPMDLTHTLILRSA